LINNGRGSSGGLARLSGIGLRLCRFLSRRGFLGGGSGGGACGGGWGRARLGSGLLRSSLLRSSGLRSLGSILLCQLHGTRRTLRLSEVTLGDTILDGLVEVSIKCSCGGDIDCVVGLNVFLDRLSAAAIAFFKVEDSILNHILVGGMAGSAGLLGRASGGSFLGRHCDRLLKLVRAEG